MEPNQPEQPETPTPTQSTVSSVEPKTQSVQSQDFTFQNPNVDSAKPTQGTSEFAAQPMPEAKTVSQSEPTGENIQQQPTQLADNNTAPQTKKLKTMIFVVIGVIITTLIIAGVYIWFNFLK